MGLASGLASYVNKHLVKHVSEKDLKEKILREKSVPSNIKNVQISDEYIQEFLVENRKSYTLNHDKVLKWIQEKFMAIFSPWTRLWHVIEEERNLIPENDDEVAAGHNDIILHYEQTILLVGQIFNSLV